MKLVPNFVYKCAKCGEKGTYWRKSAVITLFCSTCKTMTRHNYHICEYQEVKECEKNPATTTDSANN